MAPIIVKSLSRLTRHNLIDLALQWLDHDQACAPYLASNRTQTESDEEDYLHAPAQDVDCLKRLYRTLYTNTKEMTKRDIIDRIVDGDWRRGLSLEQMAMIDFAYVEQNDTCLRWSALKLVPLQHTIPTKSQQPTSRASKRRKLQHDHEPAKEPIYPQILPSTFVKSLQSEISALVKAHMSTHYLSTLSNLPIIRIYIMPHSAFIPKGSSIPQKGRSSRSNILEAGRVMYIALPSSCPYVYISLSGSSTPIVTGQNAPDRPSALLIDMASAKRIILEALPKALSRSHQRWSLENTKLVTKSLKSNTILRGNTKPGTGGGAYARFVEGDSKADTSPTDPQPPLSRSLSKIQEQSDTTDDDIAAQKARQHAVDSRFGNCTANSTNYAPLDRVRIKVEDLFWCPGPATTTSSETESETTTQPPKRSIVESAPVEITLSGTDVFGGLRILAQLARGRYVNLDKLPAILTGESGMTSLVL